MGSEVSSKGIDPSVGGLVWVRRRNGTWWPGRIMGLDELSENCLVSPKSGTPVKLLGKEDASLDWYNLEKSKRVKAFRCGEYDECIQKAKASAANPNRKAVRYARREDAILHALEIESSRKCYQKYEGISTQELSLSSLSFDFEDPNFVCTTKEEIMLKKRQNISNDSEYDGAEGTKRMKGLEDLGIAVASNRKSGKNLIIEGSHELLQPDHASLSEFDIGNGPSNETPLVSSKFSSSSFKRSRSHVTNFHESMKRKNRRRTLAKVLKNTPILSVPVSCDRVAAGLGGSSLQGVTESKVSTEPKKANDSLVLRNNLDRPGTSCTKETSPSASEQTSDTGVDATHIPSEVKENGLTIVSEFPENDCSDGLYHVPFDVERKPAKVFTSGAVGKLSSHCSQLGSVSLNSEGLDESGSTSVVHVDNVVQGGDKDTSKWQLKGKRNLRSLNKRSSRKIYSMRSIDGDESLMLDNCTQVTELEDMGDESQHLRNQRSRRDSKFNSLVHEKSLSVAKSTMQIRNKGFCSTNSVPVLSRRSLPLPSRFTNSRYHGEDVSNKYEGYSSLFAVNLEVRASYPDQHVPLVSLMSKLNGKAIVGHPLTVHVLDDGYCDLLMGNIRSCPTSSNVEQPMYHTNSSLLLDNRSNAVPVKHATVHSISSPRKSRKSKKSVLTSRKIRRLSSLTISHNKKEEKRKPLVEKSGGPITCVPLEVVFSRINEAMNCSA